MDDLLGLGKGTDKLLAVVERAVGALYRPYGIKREADAEDYKHRLVDATKRDANSKDIIESAKAQVKANMILAEGQQELEARTQARIRHEAMREQQNLENVVAGALENIPSEVSAADVDDDWLTSFFKLARTVSSTEMQALWSKVLAREVGAPGTFSPRSLDALRKMTRQDAEIFRSACRLASFNHGESVRRNIYTGSSRSRWWSYSESKEVDLAEFDLGLLNRLHLSKIGLIYEDELISGEDFPKGGEFSVNYSSVKFRFVARKKGARLRSYSLTPTGVELSVLVSDEDNEAYIEELCSSVSKFFDVSRVDQEAE
ncbi:TIGR03899 family protein [Burkholderia cenocepacia]|uniref:TIGR03899 family protein n=1 Tax=Burkholderia cepacia complex TaxID=87882 RepID=UPI002B243D11|nr:TIGR03899 family protein [Burkholderia cenocepacia]MEB2610618.1 TIGR03899 family protein [Burkholderia cenocepacia]